MSSTAQKIVQVYYPHKANARNEDNMIRLRMAHGVAGYGVYHMLLERLRMSDCYKCELDYDILCWDLACDEELIRSVIYDFGLFEIIDDGQRFCSVELNAYMHMMEQKAAERKARAQEAANARWGNRANDSQPSPTIQQSELPLETDKKIEQGTERLDKEIELIKGDKEWLDSMSEECGKSKEDIISFLPDFRTRCMLSGLKGGHKNMSDTLTHFRSWIYRSGRAKDPNDKPQNNKTNRRLLERETDALNRLDMQIQERHAKWEIMENAKVNPRIYIKNKGYDPEVVTMAQIMHPEWQKKNPPTHPEWIGKFITPSPKPIEVPY